MIELCCEYLSVLCIWLYEWIQTVSPLYNCPNMKETLAQDTIDNTCECNDSTLLMKLYYFRFLWFPRYDFCFNCYFWCFSILEIKFYKWKYLSSMSYELTNSIMKICHSIIHLLFVSWLYDWLIWKVTFCNSHLVENSSLILRWSRKLVYRTKLVKVLMKVTTYPYFKTFLGDHNSFSSFLKL